MNPNLVFNTISQVAMQLKVRRNPDSPVVSDEDAVTLAGQMAEMIVSGCLEITGSETFNQNPGSPEYMIYQTMSNLSVQSFFNEGKTMFDAVNDAKVFIQTIDAEAQRIVG